jgi:Predicted Zn peptidase
MDTKKIATNLIGRIGTNNPFHIAEHLGITIIYTDLGNTLGFFSKYKRSKFIHLNNKLSEQLENFVCAHELGHAILHPDMNTPFLKKRTLLSTDKIERQANSFAIELLMPDSFLEESGYNIYCLAASLGIPEKLVQLKKGE